MCRYEWAVTTVYWLKQNTHEKKNSREFVKIHMKALFFFLSSIYKNWQNQFWTKHTEIEKHHSALIFSALTFQSGRAKKSNGEKKKEKKNLTEIRLCLMGIQPSTTTIYHIVLKHTTHIEWLCTLNKGLAWIHFTAFNFYTSIQWNFNHFCICKVNSSRTHTHTFDKSNAFLFLNCSNFVLSPFSFFTGYKIISIWHTHTHTHTLSNTDDDGNRKLCAKTLTHKMK